MDDTDAFLYSLADELQNRLPKLTISYKEWNKIYNAQVSSYIVISLGPDAGLCPEGQTQTTLILESREGTLGLRPFGTLFNVKESYIGKWEIAKPSWSPEPIAEALVKYYVDYIEENYIKPINQI